MPVSNAAEEATLFHVVSFRFKDAATTERIKEVEEAFRRLQKTIAQIKTFDWGTNVSPEKHDKGFTHAFVLTFGSDEDRDAYLVHPDHEAFGAIVGPVVEDVFVVDFWSMK